MPNQSKRPPRLYLAHLYQATTLGIVELSNQAARLAGVITVRTAWFPAKPTVNTADGHIQGPFE